MTQGPDTHQLTKVIGINILLIQFVYNPNYNFDNTLEPCSIAVRIVTFLLDDSLIFIAEIDSNFQSI